MNEKLIPLIFFHDAGERMREYVGDVGKMNVYFRVGSYADSRLYSYAARKIPAMLYERGGHGIWASLIMIAEKEDLYKLMGEILGIIREKVMIFL